MTKGIKSIHPFPARMAPDVAIAALREVGGRERAAPGEAHLDCSARAPVHAMQARRQRRGVVGDDEIAAAQELREFSARGVRQAAVRAHHE